MLKNSSNSSDLLRSLVCKLKEIKGSSTMELISIDMEKYRTLKRCVKDTIGEEITDSDDLFEVMVIYPNGFGHLFPYDSTLEGKQIVKWALIMLPDDVPCFSITVGRPGADSSSWVYSVP